MNSFIEKDLFCPFCGIHSVDIVKTLGKTGIICKQCATRVIFTQIPFNDRIKQFREKYQKSKTVKA